MHEQNNFDGVRLLAAVAVLTSHQFVVAGRPEPHLLGGLNPGDIAVLAFFAISGFLVASSWAADPELWRFAARRLLRIWPAYAVAVIGAALWIGLTDPRPLASTAAWLYVHKHLTFQRFEWNFFWTQPDPRLNASIWTIPFELGCYVVLALAAVMLRKWWPVVLVAVAGPLFVLWAFGMATINPSISSLPVDCAWFGAFFACGAALSGLPALRTPKASGALVLAGVVAYATGSQVIGLVLTIAPLAVLVGTRSWPVLRRAGQFGDFSYGLYLWAWPVQQIVATRLGPEAGFGRLLLVSLAAATLLAFLSWHLVEKRALAAKPSSRTRWPRALTLELRRH